MSPLLHDPQHASNYYAATAHPAPSYPRLDEPLQADVCVVGGGFTGINTALELAQRGFSVVLLEAEYLGWGASGRNGGQLIRGIGHDLEGFRPLLGDEGILALQQMGLAAVELVRQRIQAFNIDCDLKWGFCDLATKPRHLEALQAEQESLQRLGYKHALSYLPQDQIQQVIGSERYLGGLLDQGSGHLHPLNLVLGEAMAAQSLGVRIFEQSAAVKIDYAPKICVHTAQGQVQAEYLVLAGNAHLDAVQPKLSRHVLPASSYLIATEPLSEALWRSLLPQDTAVCDQRAIMDYFRLSADRRLIFGGACHYSGRDPKDIAAYMRPKMLRVFPQLAHTRIEYQWSGLIGISANRLPQIGRLADHPQVFYAQAYSGHGLNNTHLAGHLLAQAISGQASTGFELFAQVPHRAFPGGRYLRAPLVALGMLWHRLRDLG